jgi:hypothetical protein
MQRITAKIQEQENALTKVLRKIIKQKDESVQKYKLDNEELNLLIQRQQELINKLNAENIQLYSNLNDMKATAIQFDKLQSENQELAFQNQSLKEQLSVSNEHKQALLKKVAHAKLHIKTLNDKLMKFCS